MLWAAKRLEGCGPPRVEPVAPCFSIGTPKGRPAQLRADRRPQGANCPRLASSAQIMSPRGNVICRNHGKRNRLQLFRWIFCPPYIGVPRTGGHHEKSIVCDEFGRACFIVGMRRRFEFRRHQHTSAATCANTCSDAGAHTDADADTTPARDSTARSRYEPILRY